MADISKITIESGTYDIKDATARNDLQVLNLLVNKKIIMIGDSYAQGYTPDGNVTPWTQHLKSLLNLSNDNCIIKAYGGTGFCNTVDSRNFTTLLDEINADNEITDIIVCGGFNDRTYTDNQIYTGISNFVSLANTKFPNAKIYIGFIGWSRINSNMLGLSYACNFYRNNSAMFKCNYLTNCEYSLHDYTLFSSDGIHPDANGSYIIAYNIAQSFLNGSCDVIGAYSNVIIKNLDSDISQQNLTNTMGTQLNNNIVQVSTQGYASMSFSSSKAFDGTGLLFKICDLDYSTGHCYIAGDAYSICKAFVPLILRDSNSKYYNATGYIYFKDNAIYLKVHPLINEAGNNYLSMNITQIQFSDGIQATFDSLLC